MEMSSKKNQHRSRMQTTKKEVRDPRFENLCGRLDYDTFRNNYSFLEDLEKEELDAKTKKQKKKKQKKEDPEIELLRRRRTERQRADRERAVLASIKKEEKEKVKSGKRPFFLKRAAIKQRILDDRFNHLRAEGKLNKFLKRKRRRSSGAATGLSQRVKYSDDASS